MLRNILTSAWRAACVLAFLFALCAPGVAQNQTVTETETGQSAAQENATPSAINSTALEAVPAELPNTPG